MQEHLEHNELMGISLKKIVGRARMSTKNIFKDMRG